MAGESAWRWLRALIGGAIQTGTGGEEANAQVCKTCIRGFKSRPVLQLNREGTVEVKV